MKTCPLYIWYDIHPLAQHKEKGDEYAINTSYLSCCLLRQFWPFGAELLPGDPLIIINKQTNELAWINHGQIVMQTIVATGKTTDLTPEGLFTIKVKAKDPYYRKKNIAGGDPKQSAWIAVDWF